MKLTDAQRRNLEHVRDHGLATPRSVAGFNCRKAGLTELVWKLPDGSLASSGEIRAMNPPPWDQARIIGERLTAKGLKILSENASQSAAPAPGASIERERKGESP